MQLVAETHGIVSLGDECSEVCRKIIAGRHVGIKGGIIKQEEKERECSTDVETRWNGFYFNEDVEFYSVGERVTRNSKKFSRNCIPKENILKLHVFFYLNHTKMRSPTPRKDLNE